MKTIHTNRLDKVIPGDLFDELNQWCEQHQVPLFSVISFTKVDEQGAVVIVEMYDVDDEGDYYILQNGAPATYRESIQSKFPFPVEVFDY